MFPLINLYKSDNYFEGKHFLLRPGDVTFNTFVPIITKTFPIQIDDTSYYCTNIPNSLKSSCNNIILKLDIDRHWIKPIQCVRDNDVNFSQKNNKMIWRGGPNGFLHHKYSPSRLTFCKKWVKKASSLLTS